MDTVAPARTSRPLWIVLAVLFVANLALWYMLPARRVVHLDGTPDLPAGGSAVRTALTVMLGAFIPAAIVAGVLALIPIGPRMFNARYPWRSQEPSSRSTSS
jgi:hypothetical protein